MSVGLQDITFMGGVSNPPLDNYAWTSGSSAWLHTKTRTVKAIHVVIYQSFRRIVSFLNHLNTRSPDTFETYHDRNIEDCSPSLDLQQGLGSLSMVQDIPDYRIVFLCLPLNGLQAFFRA